MLVAAFSVNHVCPVKYRTRHEIEQTSDLHLAWRKIKNENKMPLINHEIAQKHSLYNDLLTESRKNTFRLWKIMKNDILFLNWNSDNHGQKSWDKFTFVALLHTRQTNSSTLVHPLPLSPLLQCWTRVQAISPKFQHCIGGRGEEATHFKTDNSAFWKLHFKNTEN